MPETTPTMPAGLTESACGRYRYRGDLDRAALDSCLASVDPDDRPALLFDLYYSRKFDRTVPTLDLSLPNMCGVVASIWTATDHPEHRLGRGEWLQFLRENGYSRNGLAIERPSYPIRLWRGCTGDVIHLDAEGKRIYYTPTGWQVDPDQELIEVLDDRLGLSWTADRHIARDYAYGPMGDRARPACVYSAVVDPEYLLAYIGYRGESEFLVDPAGLRDLTLAEIKLDLIIN
jgi:hypothetical protein